MNLVACKRTIVRLKRRAIEEKLRACTNVTRIERQEPGLAMTLGAIFILCIALVIASIICRALFS